MIWDNKYKFYYWGPLLFYVRTGFKFCDEMNVRGRKLSNDYTHKLVGDIHKESQFSIEDFDYFLKNTESIFNAYKNSYKQYHGEREYNKSMKNKKFILEDLWFNVMKKGDSNPMHVHNADLSFVLFTKIPNEIVEENKNFKGSGYGPGGIRFVFGQNQTQFSSEQYFIPKKGDFFIFPSKLYHFVDSFKSDVERITIAGNINLS
tara:strand:+ start:487 stop:1098 length:612 start_codon:yes stop_codon:yes gene_type:complete